MGHLFYVRHDISSFSFTYPGLEEQKLQKKEDSNHLTEFIVLDCIVYYIYCAVRCLFSVLAADLTEAHLIPEPFIHLPVIWCPASAGLPPGLWNSRFSKTTTPTLSSISVKNANVSQQTTCDQSSNIIQGLSALT